MLSNGWVIFLRVLFRSYPPGMSLLQYFVQKIHVWSGGTSFCEWILYIAYQVFAFSFLTPFLSRKGKKHIVFTGMSFMGMVFLPRNFKEQFTRYRVHMSAQTRAPYQEIEKLADKYIALPDKVLIITQNSSNYERLTMAYLVCPGWCDIYDIGKETEPSDALQDKMYKEYDYLMACGIEDYNCLKEYYGEALEEVAYQGLYKIQRETESLIYLH